MYSVLYALPPELWPGLLITQCLSLADLTRLILTSSRLLSIIRPTLYRAVYLHAGITNVTQTWALLARDKELARRVVQLDLIVLIGTRRLADLDALMNLVSLKRVTLSGGIFPNAIEQREIGRVLASIALEELTYMEFGDGQHLFDDQLGGIHDLKKIVWRSAEKSPLNPMWDVLTRSQTTICSLNLPFHVYDTQHCHILLSMHFPHLRSLTLSSSKFDIVPDVAAADLTKFIVAHNSTIEELAASFVDASLPCLEKDSLPGLCSYAGNTSSFKIMALAHMKCLTATLRKLVLHVQRFNASMHELHSMFDAILAIEGSPILPSLKELDLDISMWQREQKNEVLEAIRLFSTCCSLSLEVWRVTLPYEMQMDPHDLGAVLGLFEVLKVIYLDVDSIPGVRMRLCVDECQCYCPRGYEYSMYQCMCRVEAIAAYVESLASSCRALEEVFVVEDMGKCVRWEVVKVHTSRGDSTCSVRQREVGKVAIRS